MSVWVSVKKKSQKIMLKWRAGVSGVVRDDVGKEETRAQLAAILNPCEPG